MQRLLALGGQRFQVTLLPQLLPDLQKLAFGGGPAQRLLHRLDVGDLLLAFGDEAAQHRFGIGGLAVFGVVFLHIAAGGQASLQRDGHIDRRIGGIVLTGQGGHALFQPVQVGAQQVAVEPQLIPAGAFFQLLQAHRPLAHQPLVDGGDLPAQSLPRQLYPFAAGFQPVKFLQQLAAGGVRRLRDIRSLILPLRQKGKVRLFAAQQQWCAALRGQCRRPFPQYGGNGGPLHRGKGANRRIARGNAVGKLTANEGGSPLQHRQQRLAERKIRPGKQPVGSIQRGGHGKIQLFLPRRVGILQPGKQRPAFACRKIHPVDGVNDLAVFPDQHQVALPPHQLAHQP